MGKKKPRASVNVPSWPRVGPTWSYKRSGRGLSSLTAMIPEAACGAEREVKVVKGNEALEGCPTTPAASEQEKEKWLGRYPRNLPIYAFSIFPPATSVFTSKVPRTSQIPSTAFLNTEQALILLVQNGPCYIIVHPSPPALLYILNIDDRRLRNLRGRGSQLGS